MKDRVATSTKQRHRPTSGIYGRGKRDDHLMLIREAGTRLASMLDDARVNRSVVAAAGVWTTVEVFRQFAAIPVDDAAPPEEDGDGVLAQFGTFDLRGRREFSADLTRQFIGAGSEGGSIWQLSCTLHWTPSALTEGLASGHLWSFNKPLDEFFAEAVERPGWAWARWPALVHPVTSQSHLERSERAH